MKSVNTEDVALPDVIVKRTMRSTTALDPKVSGPVIIAGEGGAKDGPVVNVTGLPVTPPEIGRTQYWVDAESPDLIST
jgi:hypothetical protein